MTQPSIDDIAKACALVAERERAAAAEDPRLALRKSVLEVYRAQGIAVSEKAVDQAVAIVIQGKASTVVKNSQASPTSLGPLELAFIMAKPSLIVMGMLLMMAAGYKFIEISSNAQKAQTQETIEAARIGQEARNTQLAVLSHMQTQISINEMRQQHAREVSALKPPSGGFSSKQIQALDEAHRQSFSHPPSPNAETSQ